MPANLDENALNSLKADPDVEFIEEDGIMHTSQTLIQCALLFDWFILPSDPVQLHVKE
jgi:hypothetical protein